MNAVMRLRGLIFAFALVACTVPAFAQDDAALHLVRKGQLAPADAYFGRFQMSILGMRNAIEDIAARTDGASEDDLGALYHKLVMVEDAVLDLKSHYPDDTWLPQFGLRLGQTFAKMPFADAQGHADRDLAWVVADYAQSDQAAVANDLRFNRHTAVADDAVPIEPIARLQRDVPPPIVVRARPVAVAPAAPAAEAPIPSYATRLRR